MGIPFCVFLKDREMKNTKADVRTERQRSSRSMCCLQNHCSSESRVLRNPDLRFHSSDKAVTHPHSWLLQQEVSPAPGRPDPLHCTVPSKVQHWQHVGADAEWGQTSVSKGPPLQAAGLAGKFLSPDLLLFMPENTVKRKTATTNDYFSKAKLIPRLSKIAQRQQLKFFTIHGQMKQVKKITEQREPGG